ncbi:MAG: protein-L-isoaspartate O-methyltransferase [Ramlibacter sp.]
MTAPADLEQARFNMIEQQIRPWDVLDHAILDLFTQVKRECFVPLAHRALAFVDMEIPLLGSDDEAMKRGHCMLAPRVEARMLQDLHIRPRDKVLEIGAGSGFMAALLSHRAQRVVSLELNEELARMARANLQQAGIANVDVRVADGAQGLAGEGPFDVILLSGSVAEVPVHLLAQLNDGGRFAAIIGEDPVMRFTLVTRTGASSYTTTQPWDTLAPRLANFAEPSRFSF